MPLPYSLFLISLASAALFLLVCSYTPFPCSFNVGLSVRSGVPCGGHMIRWGGGGLPPRASAQKQKAFPVRPALLHAVIFPQIGAGRSGLQSAGWCVLVVVPGVYQFKFALRSVECQFCSGVVLSKSVFGDN